MQLADTYGPSSSIPADGDVTRVVPLPAGGAVALLGRDGDGHWSKHAYGLAVDLNPRENPYVGCGMTREPDAAPYLDRTRLGPAW